MSLKYKTDQEDVSLESLLAEPEAVYSYADYLKWTFDERVELIKGKLFKMSPAPRARHQAISMNLTLEIGNFLKGKSTRLFSAPFDVRFPTKPDDPDDQTFTVVQPDLCVICDPSKLDELGCKGAPDLIIEILSPSTASKDLNEKLALYQEHGVKEYWIVYPGESIIELLILDEAGNYQSKGKFTETEVMESAVLAGLEVRLQDVFRE